MADDYFINETRLSVRGLRESLISAAQQLGEVPDPTGQVCLVVRTDTDGEVWQTISVVDWFLRVDQHPEHHGELALLLDVVCLPAGELTYREDHVRAGYWGRRDAGEVENRIEEPDEWERDDLPLVYEPSEGDPP